MDPLPNSSKIAEEWRRHQLRQRDGTFHKQKLAHTSLTTGEHILIEPLPGSSQRSAECYGLTVLQPNLAIQSLEDMAALTANLPDFKQYPTIAERNAQRDAGVLEQAQINQGFPAKRAAKSLAMRGIVLNFAGYFSEPVHMNMFGGAERERFSIRNVIVNYYMEDDTIAVFEPQERNSSRQQGMLISRRRMPVPKSNGVLHYTFRDFQLGTWHEYYGKRVRIVDCDEFTRKALTRWGIILSPPVPVEDVPQDPYMVERRRMHARYMPPPEITADDKKHHAGAGDYTGGDQRTQGVVREPRRKLDKRATFQENDAKVLNFDAVLDTRHEKYGDIVKVTIQYYLADNSVKILEHRTRNDGKGPDVGSVMLRRAQIPRDGTMAAVLDLPRNEGVECLRPDDLWVGRSITLYGRRFFITNCDEFTRSWYEWNFDAGQVPPMDPVDWRQLTKNEQEASRTAAAIAEEEQYDRRVQQMTKQNHLSPGEAAKLELEQYAHRTYPKNPDVIEQRQQALKRQEVFKKFAIYGNDSLSFEARMVPQTRGEHFSRRTFVLTFHLADDSISVFESTPPNHGFGGTMYSKAKIYKTKFFGFDGDLRHSGKERLQHFLDHVESKPIGRTWPWPDDHIVDRSELVTLSDLFPGALIVINNQVFEILRADLSVLQLANETGESIWSPEALGAIRKSFDSIGDENAPSDEERRDELSKIKPLDLIRELEKGSNSSATTIDWQVQLYVKIFDWFLRNRKSEIYWKWILIDKEIKFKLNLTRLVELTERLGLPVYRDALHMLLVRVTRNPVLQCVDFLKFCTTVQLWREHTEKTCKDFDALCAEYPDEIAYLMQLSKMVVRQQEEEHLMKSQPQAQTS